MGVLKFVYKTRKKVFDAAAKMDAVRDKKLIILCTWPYKVRYVYTPFAILKAVILILFFIISRKVLKTRS